MNLDGRTFSGISDRIPVLAMLNVQSKQHHLTNLTSKSLAWHKIFPESLKVYETEVNQQLEMVSRNSITKNLPEINDFYVSFLNTIIPRFKFNPIVNRLGQNK